MKKRYWIGLIILAFLLFHVFSFLNDAGSFKSINPHFDGTHTKTYTGAHGTEDIDIDSEAGILFVSSADRWNAGSTANGIYTLDLNNANAQLSLIPMDYDHEMNPHGISFVKEDSTSYIYCINHMKKGDYIELYQFYNDSLFLVDTFRHELMHHPNDVVGISPTEFYITNDHSSSDPTQALIEDFLRFDNRTIAHYKDGTYRTVADKLAMPNGINISNDGRRLYASTTLSHQFLTYERNPQTGDLDLLSQLDLQTGLDNIDVDAEGHIWIGCHPQLLKFLSHADDPTSPSPSQVIKLTPRSEDGAYDQDEVFLNDGSDLSGSSVAVHHNGELYIGVVFQNKVWRGQLN